MLPSRRTHKTGAKSVDQDEVLAPHLVQRSASSARQHRRRRFGVPVRDNNLTALLRNRTQFMRCHLTENPRKNRKVEG